MTVRPAGVGRVALLGVLVSGVGTLVYFGASLALLASSPVSEAGARVSGRLPGGALLICGGGLLPDEVRDRFVELAGGRDARIVVIPTAHASADGPPDERRLEPWQSRGVASVRLFHARSHSEADDPVFSRALGEATGVWIGGGTQRRLTEAYLGTEVERQLKALLARGGVIGGTSAGAAVMSPLMIVSGRTEAKLGQGFDLLPGTLIDQHFLKRNRLTRLLGALRGRPGLVGLGIDERTALVVDVANRRARVLGESYVVTCVAEPGVTAPRVEVLKPGDEADLAALKSLSTGAVAASIDFNAL